MKERVSLLSNLYGTNVSFCVLFSANKIHISESTYKRLKKTKNFKMQSRGSIDVKVNLLTFCMLGIFMPL